jgi:hypothetical protein
VFTKLLSPALGCCEDELSGGNHEDASSRYLRNSGSHLCTHVVHKPVYNAAPYLLFRIPDYSNHNCLGVWGGGEGGENL